MLGLVLGTGVVRADGPVVIRLATAAPEGSAYAREFHAFAREVEATTHGHVHVKWYFGGIGGDELAVLARIRRGQLDGEAGAMFCERLAPMMRVTHLVGLAQSHEEELYLMQRLRPMLDAQFERAGFTNLGQSTLGNFVVFSRTPLTRLEDLRRTRLWVWDLDEVQRVQLSALGLRVVPLPLDQAGPQYDAGMVDGFICPPAVALAFQWTARANYFTDLHTPQLMGCLAVANRAFDALPLDDQQAMRTAANKLTLRMADVGHYQDQQLLGGLLERQGLKPAPLAPGVQAQLAEASRAVRDRFDDRLIPKELLARALAILADYRAEGVRP